MTDKEQIKECPFGIEARFCAHQETFANNLEEAVKGNLVFVCGLQDADCPKLQEMFEIVKSQTGNWRNDG